MLLGYAVRTWGPGWRFRDGDAAAYDRREFRTARSAWTRFTTGLGAVIATAGAALALVTFILMLVNPGDGIGSTIALSVTGLLLIAVAVWAWLFFTRFGAWGIVATPNALSSYEPAHYDSRAAKTPAGPAHVEADDAGDTAGEDEAEELTYDEDELVDEDAEGVEDDDAEFAARYSKFELHHPEGEEEATVEDGPEAVDEGRFEAQYSKYESHHPVEEPAGDVEAETEREPEPEIEPIEEYVDTLTPEEVSEDIVDAADEEPVGDGDAEASIESYEDLIGRDASGDERTDAAVDAVDDDPLEVLPEAHGAGESSLDAGIERRGETREEASGREDALRRLRERQARRAQQRPDDDM
jgi:hypothetical protein